MNLVTSSSWYFLDGPCDDSDGSSSWKVLESLVEDGCIDPDGKTGLEVASTTVAWVLCACSSSSEQEDC